jgi:hypothetical protein
MSTLILKGSTEGLVASAIDTIHAGFNSGKPLALNSDAVKAHDFLLEDCVKLSAIKHYINVYMDAPKFIAVGEENPERRTNQEMAHLLTVIYNKKLTAIKAAAFAAEQLRAEQAKQIPLKPIELVMKPRTWKKLRKPAVARNEYSFRLGSWQELKELVTFATNDR